MIRTDLALELREMFAEEVKAKLSSSDGKIRMLFLQFSLDEREGLRGEITTA